MLGIRDGVQQLIPYASDEGVCVTRVDVMVMYVEVRHVHVLLVRSRAIAEKELSEQSTPADNLLHLNIWPEPEAPRVLGEESDRTTFVRDREEGGHVLVPRGGEVEEIVDVEGASMGLLDSNNSKSSQKTGDRLA